MLIDDVQPCADGTAVAVGLSSDGEIEGIAVSVLNGSGANKAEINNVDLAVEVVTWSEASSISSLILDGARIFPVNISIGSTLSFDLDGVVETIGLQSFSLVIVVEPVLECVTINTSHLDLQMSVTAGIITVLSNFDVVRELSVNIVNAGNLVGSLELENIQVAWWVPKSLFSLTIDLVSSVVLVIGLQFGVVIAVKVRARDVSGEVEVVLINSGQFGNNSSDVAGLILASESKLSSEVVT